MVDLNLLFFLVSLKSTTSILFQYYSTIIKENYRREAIWMHLDCLKPAHSGSRHSVVIFPRPEKRDYIT